MKQKIYSHLLVLVQFACITLLAIQYEAKYPSNIQTYASAILIFTALFIGFKAAYDMQKSSKIKIHPEVAEDAQLITQGIYSRIRHPMYLSVLTLCLGFVLSIYSTLSLVIYLVLVIDLLVKMNFEEKLLNEKFDEYRDYCEHTFRVIPFVY